MHAVLVSTRAARTGSGNSWRGIASHTLAGASHTPSVSLKVTLHDSNVVCVFLLAALFFFLELFLGGNVRCAVATATVAAAAAITATTALSAALIALAFAALNAAAATAAAARGAGGCHRVVRRLCSAFVVRLTHG